MAKKGTTQSKKSQAAPAEELPVVADEAPTVEPAPKFSDYVKATLGMVLSWIKTHKLKFLLVTVVAITVATLLTWVLWPGQRAPSNDEIVNQVNRELSIQGDGNPAILTVEDKVKASQPFLQGAENGDKVILYYKAKKSVLYRPSEKRVVHQGAYVPPDAKVFIRRGTENTGKVGEVEDKLDGLQDISVVSQDVSTKRDYSGVTIVNVTDRYDEKVRELETLFGTAVVRLPAGETFPEADILIIVGN